MLHTDYCYGAEGGEQDEFFAYPWGLRIKHSYSQ